WILDAGRWMTKPDSQQLNVECQTFDLVTSIPSKSMLAHLLQIITVPCRRDALARRVRPRFIRARGDALLAQLAHAPVLFVDRVPKLNRIVRFKIAPFECFRIEQPITEDQCP